jgi:hypothetical protein
LDVFYHVLNSMVVYDPVPFLCYCALLLCQSRFVD